MLEDIGAERAVLAGLFNHGLDAYVEICDLISCDSFTHQNNQILYKCIESILKKSSVVDVPSILSAAERLNFLESVKTDGELEYIRSLMCFPIKRESVLVFAAQIRKLQFARDARRIAKQIESNINDITGDETVDEIISLVEMPLVDFLRDDNNGQRPEQLGKNIDDYVQYLIENPCDQLGLSTGMPLFDSVIGGGLRRKCVDLVSARPGVGKSVFADNVALYNSRKGIPILMLDTEMSREDHLNRLIAHISGVPVKEIETGKFGLDRNKYLTVKDAAEELKNLPYTYVSVAGAPFETIINTVKRWIIREVGQDENGRTNDCLVIYDYLKLMSSKNITNNIQEYQALGFQISDLHNLTVKYDFPCLSFVQLNRDGETKESTSTAAGSDRLIWLCTSFSQFKVKSQEEVTEDGPRGGNRKIVTLKARHGPGLMDGNYINMNMDGPHFKLTELNSRDEARNDSGGIIEGADEPFE